MFVGGTVTFCPVPAEEPKYHNGAAVKCLFNWLVRLHLWDIEGLLMSQLWLAPAVTKRWTVKEFDAPTIHKTHWGCRCGCEFAGVQRPYRQL